MNKSSSHSSSNLDKYQCQHPFVIKHLNKFYKSLIQMIALTEPTNILSIGCGEGFDIKNIDEKSDVNIEYYIGLDLNFKALKIAKEILSHLPFNMIHGDIYNLPFKPDKFNLILCLEVLEHLSFPNKALKEISQRLSGYFIFSVPNEPWYRLTRLFRFGKDIMRFGNHPEHINTWSAGSFCHLIKKYFIIDQILTPSAWTIVLCHK